VAAYEQLGQFEVRIVDGDLQKTGGNVAGYFCTPSGRVIHAVAGPVSPETLLATARWTLDVFQPLADWTLRHQQRSLSNWHALANSSNLNPAGWSHRQRQLHSLFSAKPLVHLHTISEQVFTEILGQTLRHSDGDLVQAREDLQRARESGQPILFMFHNLASNHQAASHWSAFQQACKRQKMNPMLSMIKVVLLPLPEMPALSEELDISPYEAPDRGMPLFVMADSVGRQTGAATGPQAALWLRAPMAHTLVDSLQDSSQRGDLIRARSAIRKFDRRLAGVISRRNRKLRESKSLSEDDFFLATAGAKGS